MSGLMKLLKAIFVPTRDSNQRCAACSSVGAFVATASERRSGTRRAASSPSIQRRRSSASRFVLKLPPYFVGVPRPPSRYSTRYRRSRCFVVRVRIQLLAIGRLALVVVTHKLRHDVADPSGFGRGYPPLQPTRPPSSPDQPAPPVGRAVGPNR